MIAELTGIPVVSNFRPRDMAAGGQGAPLVAYVDRLLFTHPTLTRALQNIGGIANVTYLPPRLDSIGIVTYLSPSPDSQVGRGGGPGGEGEVAFDTGPGNMLIDDAAGRATAGAWAYDHDGIAGCPGPGRRGAAGRSAGRPLPAPAAPKTTGRELFGAQFGAAVWARATAAGLAPADIVATLTAFTARFDRPGLPRLPAGPA